MTAPVAPPSELLTIAQTADTLGVKPWEVVRLIESGDLDSVTFVPAVALRTHMQETK